MPLLLRHKYKGPTNVDFRSSKPGLYTPCRDTLANSNVSDLRAWKTIYFSLNYCEVIYGFCGLQSGYFAVDIQNV